MAESAQPFRIYNTLSHQVEDFVPQRPGQVGLYVCGMTVYDRAHVGHARAMVVFDSFVRDLRFRGWDVKFVRNFTDVDDKIIARASELGEEAAALAERYVQAFREDAAALGLLLPDEEPCVTTSIASIQGLIRQIIDRGHAYVAEGSVWFSVESFTDYGKLSRQKVDELRSADASAGKRHPADFALWKGAKPGEPFWDSPWGSGRPGWHIECSSMSRDCLGDTLDIHGGGLDLVFPHHENEIAQSESATGKHYANYWMHNGLLTMTSGQKMGKSLGNVINIEDVLKHYPAETLRLYYLQNHYRSPLPWNEEALPDALGMLSRLYEAREVAQAMGGEDDPERVSKELGRDAQVVLELGREFPGRFFAALDDDFNTAQALGHLFELARAINRFANHKKSRKCGGPVVRPSLDAFELIARSVGLLAMTPEEFFEEVKTKRLAASGIDRNRIETLLAERQACRANKDFARADEIRQELTDKHIEVMDRPDGYEWRVRL